MTTETSQSTDRFLLSAFGFEGGLAVVAMVGGWCLGRDPFLGLSVERLAWSGNLAAIVWGAIATIPLLGAFWLADRYPRGGLRAIKEIVERQLITLFRGATWWEIALVCAAAGFGEELLFRGLIQGTLADALPFSNSTALAMVLASIAFGICHWLTHLYAILAFAMGLCFGALLLLTDNILAPITCHALYDLFAILWLLRSNKKTGDQV